MCLAFLCEIGGIESDLGGRFMDAVFFFPLVLFIFTIFTFFFFTARRSVEINIYCRCMALAWSVRGTL